jgi:DNA-binding NarL/FixJ family response regulator
VRDDNELVVEAIRAKLELSGGFAWLGDLPDAGSLNEEVERVQPDVVLLDLDMPGRDPFEALIELSQKHPETHVLIFTGHIRSEWVDRAIDSGAWGFLSKHEDVETIVTTIRRAAAGEFVLGAELNFDSSP